MGVDVSTPSTNHDGSLSGDEMYEFKFYSQYSQNFWSLASKSYKVRVIHVPPLATKEISSVFGVFSRGINNNLQEVI